MSDQAALEQLQAELERVKKAIPPATAAKEIRDWMEQHSKEDFLAGTADSQNSWLVNDKAGGPGCCTIS